MKENLIANKNPNFNLNTTKRFIEVMNDSQTIFKIQQDGGLKSTYRMHRMLNKTKLTE